MSEMSPDNTSADRHDVELDPLRRPDQRGQRADRLPHRELLRPGMAVGLASVARRPVGFEQLSISLSPLGRVLFPPTGDGRDETAARRRRTQTGEHKRLPL